MRVTKDQVKAALVLLGIEFQDAEHEELMRVIAARLGFDLVSLRLELFGRKQKSATGRRTSHQTEEPVK